MALDPRLARIPGLGGYLAMGEHNQQQQAAELGQMARFATLEQHFAGQEEKQRERQRQAAFEAELAQAPTPEAKRAVALKYATAGQLIGMPQEQKPQGFTLGDTRYDAEGRVIARNTPPQTPQAGFTLGDKRYDASGRQIAHNPQPQTADREPAPSLGQIVDPDNKDRMLLVNTRAYRGGSLGSPGVIGISGKEPTAAGKAERVDSGRETVTSLVTTLRDHYQQLQEAGGITDPDKGTVANVAAGIASSGPGQFVGRMVGTQNQSLRNKISQQRPLLLQAIRRATGMTAKEMDSNVELKMYLAAATDPTLDIKANFAALDKLDELYGLSGVKKPATPDQPGSLPSAADIDAELARRRGRGR